MGVPVSELRAAVARARLDGDGEGLSWPLALWERLWGLLSKIQQRVMYLHLLCGHTHTEVARLLGVGRGAVDGAWRRALARIRDALPAGT